MGHVSKVSRRWRILSGALISMWEHLQSTKKRIQLISIIGGHTLLMEGAFLHMEELVGEMEAYQIKWNTS